MTPIDLNPLIVYIGTGLGGLLVLVATYYVDRFLRRRRAADALEEAITHGLIGSHVDPERTAAFVQTIVPQALQTLKVEPEELKAKIEARVSSSRSMVI